MGRVSGELSLLIMPLLNITDLRKSFADPEGRSTCVVDVPHFTIQTGHEVAVRGSSGSGKTTFLHLIAGILSADSGRITLDGIEMTTLSSSDRDRLRATKIGIIFQTFNLLQGYTCLENVLLGMSFGPGPDRGRARQLLDRMGLTSRLDYYPRQLSVGQQQRVAVARALANRPKLVLADEPTGNLDTVHAAAALRLVREICREENTALLWVSHDPAMLSQFEEKLDFHQLNLASAVPTATL